MNRYFKTCLWSPLWFPMVVWVLALIAEGIWPDLLNALPQPLLMVGFIVIMSLVFGGVQYLITLILIWPKINFFDAASWMRWVLRLPFIYAPIQLLGFLVVFAWEFDGVIDFFEVLPVAVFGVVLGHAYVAIWLLGYVVVRGIQHRTRPSCSV